MKFIFFIIFLIFTQAANACDLTNIDIGKNFDEIDLNEEKKNIILEFEIENFSEKHFPLYLFCKDEYANIFVEISSYQNKIFKVKYINTDNKKLNLIKFSKDKYFTNFKFDEENDKENIKVLQFLTDTKYYYYTFSKSYNFFSEIFEIVDPNYNNIYTKDTFTDLEK